MKILAGLITCVLVVFLSAFTISSLWSWFLVPLGLPLIGMAHAYGLGVVLTYITGTSGVVMSLHNLQAGSGKYYEKLIQGVMLPLIALLFGYIAQLFM